MKRHKNINIKHHLATMCIDGAGWNWTRSETLDKRNTRIWNTVKKHPYRYMWCVENALYNYRGMDYEET